MSKFLDFLYFTKEKFLSILTLRAFKLDFIASLNKRYWDDITRAFYSNLEPQDHLIGIQIEVCGVVIFLQEEDLTRFLKTRVERICVTNVCGEIERLNDNYNRHTYVTRILGKDMATPRLEVTTDKLDIDTHLLLYIIEEILLYKNRNYKTTSDVKLFLM